MLQERRIKMPAAFIANQPSVPLNKEESDKARLKSHLSRRSLLFLARSIGFTTFAEGAIYFSTGLDSYCL